MVGGAIKALNHENQTRINIMKTPMITLALVACGLAISEAGSTGQYSAQAPLLSGEYITQAGGGGQGNGNGNGQRTRKRDGSGGNCDGSGECDGTGNGQRARKRNGGN